MTRTAHLGPAANAAFPLGGIGTGTISVGARGELRDWEISNHPDKGSWLPSTFFALRVRSADGTTAARVLEGPVQPPYDGDSGYRKGVYAGLPRMADSAFLGEYPIARIRFSDPVLPVTVEWEGFTPLVPLDPDDSGIPGCVWRYTVTNTGSDDVAVSIAGTLANPVGTAGRDLFHGVVYKGTPSVRTARTAGMTGLSYESGLAAGDVDHATAALVTSDPDVTTVPRWPANIWGDAAQVFWDKFLSDGHVEETFTPELAAAIEARSPFPASQCVATLCSRRTLRAGETATFDFVLAWHTPNRPRAWNGHIGLPNTHRDQIVKNFYALRYEDAWAVASDLVARREQLESRTRAFHASLHRSSLPSSVRDAAAANLVALRSTTCLRIDDGSPEGIFAGWEGSLDHAGSCEGTCTHVWNYAQSVAQLFPSLERSARRIEFLHEVEPDGKMRYRANSVFGGEPWEYHAAVDGQLGTVVRLYREFLASGDEHFLRELWPSAVRALDYAFAHWDSDGDGVLDGVQHNTYDIEFIGANPLSNSMLLAALRAGSEMAAALGDAELSARYRVQAETSAARIDTMLFNGEYYQQRLDDVNAAPYQFGSGCLSDQVFGQTLAHLTGLGHILPAAHVKSALSAVVRHNFRRGFDGQANVQRTYALNDESGLLLCSWPRGGRPDIPFIYSDEVWTGIEYQVAAGLIYEGLASEGLRIVEAARDRYDGVRRNPWNEIECGNHYVRSMASWAVLQALTGVLWDAPRGVLTVAPDRKAYDDDIADFPVMLGTGWGRVRIQEDDAELVVEGGEVRLREIRLALPGRTAAMTPCDPARTLTAGERVQLACA